MSVLMAVAMPSWRHQMQREREAELIFRGEQYARAVGLFQRKFAGTFPPSIDVLYQQKFLRKKYKDPMTPEGQFQVLYQASAAQPGVPGGGGIPIGGAARPGVMGSGPPIGPSNGSPVGAGPPPAETGGPSTGSAFGSAFGSSSTTTAPGTQGPGGGVIGVASKSAQKSIRLYNGRNVYNQWQFVYTAATIQGGQAPGGGATRPGVGGQGGPAGRPGPGGTASPRPGMTPGGATSPPIGSGFPRRSSPQ